MKLATPPVPSRSTVDELWAAADLLSLKTPAEARSQRGSHRIEFRREQLTVTFFTPGVKPAPTQAVGRDLSYGGIGFFARGFVYPETRCEVVLGKHAGGSETLSGAVVHCCHLVGTWHRVGVKFDEQIYPAMFLGPPRPSSASRAKATLSGEVLVLEPVEADRRTLAREVERLGGQAVAFADLAEAAAWLKERHGTPVSGVIANLAALAAARPGGSASPDLIDTIATLLSRIGSRALIDVGEPEATAEGRAGVKATLHKPITADGVAEAVAEATGEPADDAAPIRSQLVEEGRAEGELAELLEEARRQIGELGMALPRAVTAEDLAACQKLASRLKYFGTSFGYAPLASTAAAAAAGLAATQDVGACRATLDDLAGICRRCTS